MNRVIVFRIVAYSLAFFLHALLVGGSSGWSTKNMRSETYLINSEFFIGLTDTIIGLLFMSSFLLFIPVVITCA